MPGAGEATGVGVTPAHDDVYEPVVTELGVQLVRKARAFRVTVVPAATLIPPEYAADPSFGSDPSLVQRMVVWGVAVCIVTWNGPAYVPAAGWKLGAAA